MQVEILESNRTSTAACNDVSLLGALKQQQASPKQISGAHSKSLTFLLQLRLTESGVVLCGVQSDKEQKVARKIRSSGEACVPNLESWERNIC
ncbi:hypothetical protein BELL_0375g00100 [Botrytis elliptica]|uniref:Uncharacterized protein n=1 Tax=Botrytis elliptica TaxID=278938 RepID=A0A4Z1JNW3_9HELO|nr:hypothetical protein BELL_0375g00100 [Botrytis elliptica]